MALRIEKDVLRDLETYARSIGEKPSTLARMLIKEGLMSRGTNLSLEALPEILQLKIDQSKASQVRAAGLSQTLWLARDDTVAT